MERLRLTFGLITLNTEAHDIRQSMTGRDLLIATLPPHSIKHTITTTSLTHKIHDHTLCALPIDLLASPNKNTMAPVKVVTLPVIPLARGKSSGDFPIFLEADALY